jgi:hypothetical protein
MSNEKTYYQKRLPDLIAKLKSQVTKNYDVINRSVESELSSDKYPNVLKGKRLAVEQNLRVYNQIDKLQTSLNPHAKSYREDQLPYLIERLKEMVDINLNVVDIDIDESNEDEYKTGALSEDKYINVLKAREIARVDSEWALQLIDDLEKEIKGEEKEIPGSWAKIATNL